MKPPARIFVAEPNGFSPTARAILEDFGTVDMASTSTISLSRIFAGYDVVWVRLARRVGKSHLRPPVRCRLLAVPTTGLDHIDLVACEQAGVEIVSLRGETAFLRTVRATAELTLALALALLRYIPKAAEDVRIGNWNRDRFRGRELYGKTAGVVGVGRLGSMVAQYFAALGMEVIGWDVRTWAPDVPAKPMRSLASLLAEADLVTLHVSLDDMIRPLIGRAELSSMKPSAVLLNTSRGGVIDEEALIDALSAGRLAGAALDVLDGEPYIDAAHPLVSYARDHDNLLIVPHIGGNTVESFEKTEVFVAERVRERWASQ